MRDLPIRIEKRLDHAGRDEKHLGLGDRAAQQLWLQTLPHGLDKESMKGLTPAHTLFWIGLSVPSLEKGWTWLNDPQLHTALYLFILVFQLTPHPLWKHRVKNEPCVVLCGLGPGTAVCHSVQFKVIVPAEPITALVGDDVVLPCHLSPETNAKNMKVRWFQNKFSSPVHLYHAGKDQDREQMPEYNGRTQLLKDGIGDGNVTLRILSIRTSDEGQYHCFVENGTYYEEGILELKVAAIGSEPLISVEDYQDGGIWVACQGSGWYPEPEMAWKNPGGQHLQSVSKTEAQKEHGLFEKQNSIIIREDSSEILSCSITNSHLHQEKICRIYISGPFFPSVSSWMVAFSVNLVVSLIFITLTIYLFKVKGKLEEELKWRRKAKHPEILTLDAETAHPILVLSHDLKSVRWGQKRKILPENPKRFDTWRCVLTCEGFTTGKHYWEVRLEGKGDWVVGVAKESAGMAIS
ncbi:hypothetical protein Y1Q_0013893 [Alligator mississippiensis]|uniref:Butyrophilin subfamily 1 member A1-like n=1 Tax=Alligator mississippiensis TaxID=8496 RepID=A0A151MP50_ALLMI|nr:hypothetical protein Y1Q_0013893 [Alligator mississippiensis]